MTNGFAEENFISGDEFGDVYRGEISEHGYSGKVFVRSLVMRARGADLEFKKQILTPHHANIISLLGFYYISQKENQRVSQWVASKRFLIYEFIPNGSLYDYLFTNQDHIPRLTVEQRLQICIGVAKGLCHLHSQEDYAHGDIRTKNVLLDASLVPKISSLSTSMTHEFRGSIWVDMTTPGAQPYLAPECFEIGSKRNQKSDVYAFSIVLLEVLCERPASKRLLFLALPLVIKGELPEFTPEYVEKYISPECARRCENLIMDCLKFQPEKRPDMSHVLHELELALNEQKQYQDHVQHQNIKLQANNEQVISEPSSKTDLACLILFL